MGDVTDLKQFVLDFVNAVRRRPQIGSDPGELDNLEKAALTSYQGAFGALHAPIAPETWEARTLFLGANATSERISLDIPFPCMIVGAYTSISVLTTGGATTPTLNDIDCALDLNTHEYMTQIQGTTTPIVGGGLQKDGTFTTLAALSCNQNAGARLLGWVVPYRTAQIGVSFRWKQGGGVYKDTHTAISFFARPLQEQ